MFALGGVSEATRIAWLDAKATAILSAQDSAGIGGRISQTSAAGASVTFAPDSLPQAAQDELDLLQELYPFAAYSTVALAITQLQTVGGPVTSFGADFTLLRAGGAL